MGRGEVPKRHRDIRSQENQDLAILEIPRRDNSRESWVDTCQEIPQSQKSENRSLKFIGKLGTPVTSDSYTLKLRNPKPR